MIKQGFKTVFARALIAVAATLLGAQSATAAAPVPAAPQLPAKAYILIDADSGAVLAEKDVDVRLHPASLTKLMTSYVASHELASGDLKYSDMVTVSLNAWSAKLRDSSLMFIEVGKQVSVEDLLKGIIISSGNDASVALAEHVAGTVESFADMMNTEAKRIGMNSTHFVNPHGLDDPEHYTTARDLATLARHIIKDYPADYAHYSVQEFTFNGIRQYNRNGLLRKEGSGVDGLKTGHTDEAGYCLVASAKRENMRLISVVMGAASISEREAQTMALLNYGFRYFETRKMASAGDVFTTTRIWGGDRDEVQIGIQKELFVTVPRKKDEDVQRQLKIPSVIKAPVAVGQQLGVLEVRAGDKLLLSEPVVALNEVQEAGFFGRIWDSLVLFFKKLFGQIE